VIELTEDELEAVAGGAGSASLTLSATASGTNAVVSGTGTIATTASLLGTLISTSTWSCCPREGGPSVAGLVRPA
jgi:hypothetical protein